MNYKRKKSYWQQDIKKADYGKVAFKGLALLSGIAYLFYDFFLGGLMFSPFLVIYLRIWEKQYIKKQQQEFCAQFKMSLQSMSSGAQCRIFGRKCTEGDGKGSVIDL